MAEIRKTKLSEQTSDRLYEMIVDEQRYAPGSKLPNENELSEALKVSRRFTPPTPMRHIADLAKPFLSLGNQYGEGWFLCGEMAELLVRALGLKAAAREADVNAGQ